jgi:hypothetical protein
MRPVVIRLGDVVESLLPSSVPQLEFDELFLEVEGSKLVQNILESEVNTNGGKVAFIEFVVSETFEEGGFADGCRSNEDDFEYVVVLALH